MKFVPKTSYKDFLPPLQSLKRLKYVEIEYHDLLAAFESQKMAESVEKAIQGIKVIMVQV